jgi:outer membrane usher protein
MEDAHKEMSTSSQILNRSLKATRSNPVLSNTLFKEESIFSGLLRFARNDGLLLCELLREGGRGIFLTSYLISYFFSTNTFAFNNLSPPTTLLLNLYCNGEDTSQIVYVLQDEENTLWLKKEAFSACHLPIHAENSQVYEDEQYYAVSDTSEVVFSYNPQELSLNIIVPTRMLPFQSINYNAINLKKLRPKKSGAYLNYDVSLQRNTFEQVNNYAAITDFIYFNHLGVGHAEFLLKNSDHTQLNDQQKIVRLETTWTLDKPEKMATWRIGDSISSTAIWTGSVKFGGVQYATNFAVQPGFVTFPLPSFRGEAIVPTTVDFYLNNQLQNSQELAGGPFDIQGLPVITGAGDVLVQTKDLLGRQTVAVIPYYVSPQFLKPGLTSFSYELGAIRQDFGIKSNRYNNMILVGTYQKGLTNSWTAGWHGEVFGDTQTVGLNSSHVLYNFAQIDLAAAFSHRSKEKGGLLLLGAQRNASWYNLGIRAISATRDFHQLGIQEEALAPKLTLQSNASVNIKYFGSLALSHTERLGRTEQDISVTTISYHKNIFRHIFYTMSYVHQHSHTSNNSCFISFAWSPKAGYNSSLTYETNHSQRGATATFSKNLPTHQGYGYNILASELNAHLKADFFAQSNYGEYQAHYSRFEDKDNYEVGARGSLLYFDAQFLLARKIQDSFVLVEVPKLSEVPVYKSNQLIGKTNSKGYLLIPQTLSYDENVISIHPEELPMNTKIEVDKLSVYPYHRSGELISFPISIIQNIEFKLITPTKEVVPAGAMVILENGASYPVGYEGQVFISEIFTQPFFSGLAKWGNQTCYFSSPLQQDISPIISLGTLTCGSNAQLSN